LNIAEAVDFIQFWINKKSGAWYTIDEAVSVVDAGQMALYRDLKPKYATSQWVKDALSPFREVYNFTTAVSGNVIVPDTDYLDLLDIQIYFLISNRTVYAGVEIVAEDERANRLNSQIDPVTITSPIAEIVAPRFIRMYPTAAPGYTGTITYLKRPPKPVFVYTVISGSVIVFNEAASTNLQWRETELNAVLLKALSTIGINLSDEEITQYAEMKNTTNFQGINKL